MELIRDLTVGELEPLLEQVNVLIIPQANPYGNDLDQRRNEQSTGWPVWIRATRGGRHG